MSNKPLFLARYLKSRCVCAWLCPNQGTPSRCVYAYMKATCANDRAPAHFKNRYQFHKLQNKKCRQKASVSGNKPWQKSVQQRWQARYETLDDLFSLGCECIEIANGFICAIKGKLNHVSIHSRPHRSPTFVRGWTSGKGAMKVCHNQVPRIFICWAHCKHCL